MASKIYRRIPECNPDLIEAAGKLSVVDLHESMDVIPGRMALFDARIRPLNHSQRLCGQAFTAYTFPGDGLIGHRAVQLAGPGHVLVFANGGCGPMVMFGEMVGLAARQQGIRGAVLEGCVRDTEALTEMQFPVWSTGVFAGHLNKVGQGSINVPIVCGGVHVQPGDVIVADSDGVICLPLNQVAEVLERAKARAAREMGTRADLNSGKPMAEIFNVRSALDAAGIEEFDCTWEE
ncbi:MAG TPA: 4-carboxy-4-hydroxy-2-oxoadipate aldolase/oxaloacetate decarboxylase [Caulobacteraceae bacterium]|jgi:4-hydroxy-4-methyl-2-oxoglutarate aldolase